MSNQPDYQEIIARLSRQLKLLSPEQTSTRIGRAAPTVSDIVQLLTNNKNAALESILQDALKNENYFYLGQLVVLAEILVAQNKRPGLVRWFE